MNIITTGRHVKVTEAMKSYASEKASKFERIWSAIDKVSITMDIEHDTHVVEAVVHVQGGENIAAQAKESDMYAALDIIEDKVEKQLRKLKGKQQSHHPRFRNAQAKNEEPSYQDIVREELEAD
jgi:putative sigma-54 modulation protein